MSASKAKEKAKAHAVVPVEWTALGEVAEAHRELHQEGPLHRVLTEWELAGLIEVRLHGNPPGVQVRRKT